MGVRAVHKLACLEHYDILTLSGAPLEEKLAHQFRSVVVRHSADAVATTSHFIYKIAVRHADLPDLVNSPVERGIVSRFFNSLVSGDIELISAS